MTDGYVPGDSGFGVGEAVRFRRDIKDPFLANVRVSEGDEGEIVHVLPHLVPPAVVVKLENPRLPNITRVVVQTELLELTRKPSMAAHPSAHRIGVVRTLPVARSPRQNAPRISGLAPVIPIGRGHADDGQRRTRARA
ncbi:hypothetical protein [Sinomonas gamaensis]|uniref:hypothetical protein n=1 Tax=Sinomonas gamaensis TaxID=2565624 RepID=UPI001108582A|nr:hypothetical protein [Sinomonas gamaensis]